MAIHPPMLPDEPIHILLVGDANRSWQAIEAEVRDLASVLVRASSGEEALDRLQQGAYALVMIDSSLRDLAALSLAAMIRADLRQRDTEILLIWHHAPDANETLRAAQADAEFLVAPPVAGVLRVRVARMALRRRETGQWELRCRELETRLAHAKQEAMLARREAERANQLKDTFLATLTHEIRTPLNAITGWSHLLQHGLVRPEDQATAFSTISRNAQAQAQLISDLLDVARIVSGKLRLELSPQDVGAALRETVAAIAPLAEVKRVCLAVVAPAGLPAVSADPPRLRQVIWNLLSNAVKFAPEGGHVEARLGAVPGGVELTVQDDGPGIPESFLPHVFRRFRLGDEPFTPANRGLGMGLAIAQYVLELHGGSIDAGNRRERSGAVFRVFLPESATPATFETPLPAVSLARTRVLLVEDDEDGRILARRVLEQAGAEVVAAASAAEAWERLPRQRPHVLVTDIEMPLEDGYSLLRRIRALPGQAGRTPAIALTAYSRPSDRERLLAAGFQCHLAKPVTPPELIKAVAGLAGTRP